MAPELLALLAHDLKNALGGLEAQLGDLAAAPDRPQALAAQWSCARLRQRLVGFLTLYRADDGLVAHRGDESPQDLLQSLCDRQPPGLRERLALTVLPLGSAGPPKAPLPHCWMLDRHLVLLALDAALHNAAHFAHHTVQLSAHTEGPHLVLRIDDDGPGPATGDRATGAEGADARPHATGLGTALCAAVAQAHDLPAAQGRVTLQPRPGGGARFELWLPG